MLWLPEEHKLSHEMNVSRGFRMMTIILLQWNTLASGITQGECVLAIHTLSSTMSSPFIPYIWTWTLIWNVLSAPVATPVISSKYRRMNELPDLGHDANATLFPIIGSPSRNLNSPSNCHACSFHNYSSFDLKRSHSCFKFIVLVCWVGLTRMFLSIL